MYVVKSGNNYVMKVFVREGAVDVSYTRDINRAEIFDDEEFLQGLPDKYEVLRVKRDTEVLGCLK